MKIILPVIFILGSILIFIFGINNLYKDVKSLRVETNAYNTALDSSTDLQKTQDALLTAYNQIPEADKTRLNDLLPSSLNNIQFILEVERIANLQGMPIKDIKFEAKKKDNGADSNTVVAVSEIDTRPYGVFPIEFTTEGNYDSFLLFLKSLESNLRLSDVKSISFSVPEDNGKPTPGVDPNVYRYVLKVETYWLK